MVHSQREKEWQRCRMDLSGWCGREPRSPRSEVLRGGFLPRLHTLPGAAGVGAEVTAGAESSVGPRRLPVTQIEPSKGWVSLRLAEVWKYRELMYFLSWREVKIRYKQTALGAAWAIIQPLLLMVIFSLFFGKLAGVPSDGLPYPVWSFAALLPWQYFAQSLTQGSNSLVGNADLIRKVYFPRLVVPIAGVLPGVTDFAIAFVALLVMMAYFGITPGWLLLLHPLFLLLAAITALGGSLWLSALNVKYRDFRHVVPFLIQFWMFATPVAYPSSLLPPAWRVVYGVNPMVGVVEGFRWTLLGTEPPGRMIGVSVVVACMILVSGAFYFRRVERSFADIV